MSKKKQAVIGISMLIMVLMLVGCSTSKSSNMMTNSSTEMAKQESTTESIADSADNKMDVVTGSGEDIQLTLDNKLNRKIIKRGELEIETKHFEETINSIFKKVDEIGGFVESSHTEGTSYYDDVSRRYADMTVRVPNKQFDAFINGADTFGNIIARGMSGEDVTDAYVDTEARLRSLEVQRTRLMELLEKSGTLEELFAIEKEYANVTYEIEALQGTLNKYDSLIDYSTVTISIREVQNYQNTVIPATLGDRIIKRFQGSMQGLKILAEDTILFMVGFLPFAVIITGVLLIVFLIIRRLRRK